MKIVNSIVALCMHKRSKEEAESYRKQARQLLDDLAIADRALSSLQNSPDSTYDRCPKHIDAIRLFLTNNAYPASKDEIANALMAAGWRGGTAAARTAVLQSIGIFVNGTGAQTKKKRLREFGDDLFGLWEWDVSMFPQIDMSESDGPPGPKDGSVS